MQLYSSWIYQTIDLLDGDGCFRHWKYSGSLSEQPYMDFMIWKVVKHKWIELKNEELKNKYGK